MQNKLFRLKILRKEPATFGTADCQFTGVGDDGHEYVLKCESDGHLIPASEYICSNLAHYSGLLTPPSFIAEMQNGEYVFASRVEKDLFSEQDRTKILMGNVRVPDLGSQLSAIFAFDLFVYNVDRHTGNYLFKEINGLVKAIAIDYSRAWLTQGTPIPVLPLKSGCHTHTVFGILIRQHGFDIESANSVLDKLKLLDVNEFSKLLSNIPDVLLDSVEAQKLIDWWDQNLKKRIGIVRDILEAYENI